MKSPAKFRVHSRQCGSEQGYVLLVLILFVALLAIAVTVMLPSIGFELKRDREEELIHRGVQYTRAIQHYVKKFGRYPTTLEQLENTNQIRFLRRRYKDPITGKDFKLLHMEDVQTSFGAGIAGATPVSQMAPGVGPGSGGGFGGGPLGNAGPGIGGLGNQGFGGPGFGSQGILQPAQPGIGGNAPQQGGFGQGGFAGSTNQGAQSGDDTGAAGAGTFGGPNAPGGTGAPGTNTSSGGFGSSSSNQVFGGGPIVGVASISKDKTIRVFNKKDRYYQWQFIYNPAMDRGGLLTGPGQPASLGVASSVGTPAGANSGTGTQAPGGLGSGSTFGSQPNQPNSPITQPPQMPPEQ